MTRSLFPLTLAAVLVGCDAPTTTPADTGAEAPEEKAFSFGFIQAGVPSAGPAAGLAVQVFDAADLGTPLAEGTADAEGWLDLAFPWPEGAWAVRASGAGYHDAWFWYTKTLPDQDGEAWGSIPVWTDAGWVDLHQLAGQEPDATRGLLGFELSDPSSGGVVLDVVASVEPAGTVVYFDQEGGLSEHWSTGDGGAFVFDLPPGPVDVVAGNDAVGIERSVTVFADASTVFLDQAEAW